MSEQPERPSRPTIDQLRDVVQPPHIRNRATAEHWTGTLYMRHISIYLTRILVMTPISANGVTALMILFGFLAGPALLLGTGGVVLAAFFAQIQMYLDASDGEVARWRGVSSPKGIFLDQVGHFVAEGSIALFIGLRAAGFIGGADTNRANWYLFALVGALFMAGVWLNKALNLMVTVARVNAGLPKIDDAPAVRAVPAGTLLGRLRRLARFVPMHRAFHSIELTLLTLAVTICTLWVPDQLAVYRWYAVIMMCSVYLVAVGHFIAIWSSARLAKR